MGPFGTARQIRFHVELGGMRSRVLFGIAVLGLLVVACDGTSTTTLAPTTVASTSTTTPTTTTTIPMLPSAEEAEAFLIDYFAAAQEGRYQDLAHMYGGSLQALIDWNPPVDPNDAPALFESACNHQLLCDMRVRQVVERVSDIDLYEFHLEFEDADGNQFVIQRNDEDPILSTWRYRVVVVDNRYWVMELPVFGP